MRFLQGYRGRRVYGKDSPILRSFEGLVETKLAPSVDVEPFGYFALLSCLLVAVVALSIGVTHTHIARELASGCAGQSAEGQIPLTAPMTPTRASGTGRAVLEA